MNKFRLEIRRPFPNIRAVKFQTSLLIKAVGQKMNRVQNKASKLSEGDYKVWLPAIAEL